MRILHPHQWIWEPLEMLPGFVLRSMFGAKAVYLDGKIVFCFSDGKEPWRGMLVCTDRDRQPALQTQFPSLVVHPVLTKWLYLPESADSFERDAAALVALAKKRDVRIGVIPKPRKKKRRALGERP